MCGGPQPGVLALVPMVFSDPSRLESSHGSLRVLKKQETLETLVQSTFEASACIISVIDTFAKSNAKPSVRKHANHTRSWVQGVATTLGAILLQSPQEI